MAKDQKQHDLHPEHPHLRPTLLRMVRILESINVFSFILALLAFGIFLLGNFQGFLDSSLRLLMEIIRISGLICAFSALYYLVALVSWMIRRKKALFFRLVYGIISLALGLFLTVSFNFVSIIVSPISELS